MLGNFGAVIRRREIDDEGHRAQEIVLSGQPELVGRAVQVTADPSSAAFPLVAALLLLGPEVRLPAVGLKPQRIGVNATLLEMGGEIVVENRRAEVGKPEPDTQAKGVGEGET